MRKLHKFLRGRLFPCALLALGIVLAGVLLAIRLPRALAPIALVERFFSLIVAVIVAADAQPKEYALSKLVLVILLPWTGAIICLLSRRPAREGQKTRVPCTASTLRYFAVGGEMRAPFLADIRAAKKFVWLQYYIIAPGAFWNDALKELEKRAAAGVDVRVLYDDFGCSLTLPRSFEKELARRGIRACGIRKVRAALSAGRRDHRKLAVIDAEIAYTGGINLADEYTGEKVRFGHWKDTALRLTGEAAFHFAELFSQTWNEARPADTVPPFSVKKTSGAPCEVIADSAERTRLRMGPHLLCELVSSCRERIYLTTPYLAPDAPLLHALKGAALAGKDVRVMIPHLPDKKMPFLVTRAYARELLRAGVKVREYTAGFLHAKNVVADGETVFISSYNLDFRSMYQQAECGALVTDMGTAKCVECDFLSCFEQGSEVKKASFPVRFFSAVLRLFAPLM